MANKKREIIAINFGKTYAPEILVALGSVLLAEVETEYLLGHIGNYDNYARKYANDLLKGFVEESYE